MDVNTILKQLRDERTQLEEAILALERLQIGSGRRRGRPPKWMQALQPVEPVMPKRRGRPPKNAVSQ
jgi:hypothetical protein